MLNYLDIQGDPLTCTEVGNKLYLGGNFTSVNGLLRNNLAVIDLSTGLVDDWSPNPNGAVNKLISAGDNKIIALGGFTSINGSTSHRISIGDTNSQTFEETSIVAGLQDINASPNPTSLSDMVYHSGTDTVYVCGAFAYDTPNGQRGSLLGLTGITGTSQISVTNSGFESFLITTPNQISQGRILGVDIDQLNGILYYGGGNDITGGASFDVSDKDNASVYTWTVDTNSPVEIISFMDDYVYAGGVRVQKINGGNSNGGGLTDKVSGTFISSPDVSITKQVYQGETYVSNIFKKGNLIYILGSFTHSRLNSEPRACIAIIDASTNSLIGDSILMYHWEVILYLGNKPSTQPNRIQCSFLHEERLHLFGDMPVVDGSVGNLHHYIMLPDGKRLKTNFLFANL